MKQILAVILSVFALAMVGCAHGHHKGHDGHHGKKSCGGHKNHFQKMDANGDGAVSKAEFDKAHADKFTAIDANKDGKITMEEKMAYKKAKHGGKKKPCCK